MNTKINTEMMLSRTNLGERQKDLNIKVNDAVKNDISVTKLKPDKEKRDIDVFYNIDVAAKTKTIDYIIEIFKCGDDLYISRALKKCTWLGEQEFENLINPEHLNQDIFPSMSIKMKKKVLKTLPTYLKNDGIIIEFYKYCFQNYFMNEASKFLLIVPELFKLQFLRESNGVDILHKFYKHSGRDEYIKHFIKDSFTLAEHYLSVDIYGKQKALTELAYMYSLSSAKYLDLMEAHDVSPSLGNRISKDILKKYKDRIFKRPALYIESLSITMLIKHTSIQDAKTYLKTLIKSYNSSEFEKFYNLYETLFNIIPECERFIFIRKIFLETYPDKLFDTDKRFYTPRFYDMTDVEKEAWALSHIKSAETIFESNDYLCFLNFNKAFIELQKIILITTDKAQIIDILIILNDSAKTPENIETLLNYFYDKHLNQTPFNKEQFITSLHAKHDITKFNKTCWMALEKIFYSMNIYDNQNYYMYSEIKDIALYYYIINGLSMPGGLKKYIYKDVNTHIYELKLLCSEDKLKQQLIYEYLLQFYVKQLETFNNENIDEDEIKKSVDFILTVLQVFEKSKDDIPDVVLKFIILFPKYFKQHSLLAKPKLTQNDINLYLKKDARLLLDEFPKIKEYIEHQSGTINWVIRKLKIYFSSDISGLYLQILKECLLKDDLGLNLAKVAVYGVYVLSHKSFKNDFLKKYLPVDPKIDYVKIPRNQLYIQQAICGLVYHARPRVSLRYYLPYIKGDYVNFCLPVFNAYLVNLPTPLCVQFVKTLLNKPISIEKHGIRLAFQSFPVENLVKLVEKVWKKTKNVSLRKIIYCALFKKTADEKSEKQGDLFELLKKLTSDLNQDDDEEVFNLLTKGTLPAALILAYLRVAWATVNKFPKSPTNIDRMVKIVHRIETQLTPDEVIDPIVAEFVNEVLEFEPLPAKPDNLAELKEGKLNLIQMYLVFVTNNEQLQKRINMIKQILNSSFASWDRILNNKYVVKEFFFKFLGDVAKKAFYSIPNNYKSECFTYVIIIFEEILKSVLNPPEREVYFYTLVWELRLNIATTKIITVVLNEANPKDVRESINETITKLATEFANLVKIYMSEGKYFGIFHEELRSVINFKLRDLTGTLIDYWSSKTKNHIAFEHDDANIAFCKELIKSDIREAILMAVSLLPNSCPEHLKNDYNSILEKLNSMKDEEIQFYIFQKLSINNGFQI